MERTKKEMDRDIQRSIIKLGVHESLIHSLEDKIKQLEKGQHCECAELSDVIAELETAAGVVQEDHIVIMKHRIKEVLSKYFI